MHDRRSVYRSASGLGAWVCRGLALATAATLALGAAAATQVAVPPRPPMLPPATEQAPAASPPARPAEAIDERFASRIPWRFLGPHDEPEPTFDQLAIDLGEPWTIYAGSPDGYPWRLTPGTDSPFTGDAAERFVTGPPARTLVPDPRRPGVVYATADGGLLLRHDSASGQLRAVSVWPRPPVSPDDRASRYRFLPDFPVFFSAHDPDAIYAAGNLLFVSTDGGQSWAAVSPELAASPGADGSATLVDAFESALEPGVLWTGSSDGRVHVSRDFAASWQEVTPPGLAAGSAVELEPHASAPGTVYLASRPSAGGEAASLWRSDDYGASWVAIGAGLPAGAELHALLADPARSGLLFAGTSDGLYFSFDDGRGFRAWPVQPPGGKADVRALAAAGEALVVSIAGRGLWAIDDLGPLRQLDAEALTDPFHLFTPRSVTLRGLAGSETAHRGLAIFYRLGELAEGSEIELEILDPAGEAIRSFSTVAGTAGDAQTPGAEPGLNRFDWDLRRAPASAEGAAGWIGGPRVAPGAYLVRLAVGPSSTTAQFRVVKDPRSLASREALEAQLAFVARLDALIARLDELEAEIGSFDRMLAAVPPISVAAASEPAERRSRRAQLVVATRELRQEVDALAARAGAGNGGLPAQLARLARLAEMSLDRPTDPAIAVLDELEAEIETLRQRLRRLEGERLPALNALRREAELPALLPALPRAAEESRSAPPREETASPPEPVGSSAVAAPLPNPNTGTPSPDPEEIRNNS